MKLVRLVGMALCVACSDSTPPMLDPVVHDVTLTFTSLREDFQTTTYPMNQSFAGTLAVDFLRGGAAFEMSSNPPCMFARGAVIASGQSFKGEFHGGDYSPLLSLTGSKSSTGVIDGSFTCYSHWGPSPHHDTYTGTFRATPRQ